MKKLGKLRLHNSVIMKDCELKNIVGGEPTMQPDPGSTGTVGDFFADCSSFSTKDSCDGGGNCLWGFGGTGRGRCHWHIGEIGQWCDCDPAS